MENRKELLLHSCCGPCSTAVIARLYPDYHITVFFYNPNIDCREEYLKRKSAQIQFIDQFNAKTDAGIGFIEGDWDPELFHRAVAGLEKEKEGGLRCHRCFSLRLEKTAKKAEELKLPTFTTTLTVSPHKDYAKISEIGKQFADKFDPGFLDLDFKKKDGYRQSVQLSKQYGLYRQNFCGCSFSRRKSEQCST